MPDYPQEIERILAQHKLYSICARIAFYELRPDDVIADVRYLDGPYGRGRGSTHAQAVYSAMLDHRLRSMLSSEIQFRLAALERRLNGQHRHLSHFVVERWGGRRSTHPWSIRLFSGDLLLAESTDHALFMTMIRLVDTAHKTLSKTSTLSHLLDEISAERGTANEGHVLRIIKGLQQQNPWITALRPATEREDARGIDLVIETDQGQILLQVKSSLSGREAFMRNSLHDPSILIIVVDGEDSEESLAQDILVLLRHRHKTLSWHAPTQST